jgi:N-acetylmuramoyl-L-alanine amidase
MIPLNRIRPAPASRIRRTPNHGPRPAAAPAILCVVLHATQDGGNGREAEEWLCNPASQASAHLLIHRDGSVVRLVPDHRRAWHAGVSRWQGRADVNDFSLGWEICNRNDGRERYTEAQYAAVLRLAAHYVRQGLPLEAFVSHAAVALPPGRKSDPRGWDWTRFRSGTLRLLEHP